MRRFRAFGKFNLCLGVLGKREDGYHEIDTILQSISLADDLFCEPLASAELIVECEAAGVPSGRANLAWKALELLRDRYGVRAGLKIRIEKHIPAQAGLGGGSADAACALAAADRIWGLGREPSELEAVAADVGSDVPFFIRGGTRRCRGRGERTEAVEGLPPSRWAIIKPPWGLGTAEVYGGVGSGLTADESRINMVQSCLAKRDLSGVLAWMFNDLESAAMSVRSEAGEIKAWMLDLGMVGVVLAGSGSAWVGRCPKGLPAHRVRREAEGKGWRAFEVETSNQGWIEVQE
ncbi:MAG: 4-(cytidine 5'-diphospho)-2-C-methyl-D-erythritol kinase [Candidatus Eisenbacteria bacterium]